MANPKSDDLYKRLGIAKGATDKEIAKAYKKSALKYHPDKNPAGEEDFKRVTEAYEVLSDEEKRKQYDQFGIHGANAAGVPGGNAGGAHYASGADFAHFDNVFKTFFGGNPFASSSNGGNSMFMSFGADGLDIGQSMGMNNMPFPGFGNNVQFQPPSAERRMNSAFNIIEHGTLVIVQNLQSNPELNGRSGYIDRYDASKGRYDVKVQKIVALKPANLVICANVKIIGLVAKPELNGASGRIVGFDRTNARYSVEVNDNGQPKIVKVQTSNIILPPSTRVMIVNLENENAKRHNDTWGTIANYDVNKQRYDVVLADGKSQLRLQRDKCQCSG